MGVTTWTEAQDEILLQGLKTDQTYSQIADQLGMSKAMVSGRIHRLRKTKAILSLNTRVGSSCLKRKGNRESAAPRNPERSTDKKFNASSLAALNWKAPSVEVHKPQNAPMPFMQLKRGFCSWCVDDEVEDAGAGMMCCAAPVMDKSKREGDRRASHCLYHFKKSIRPK
ncbi:MAG: hypothetical protein JJ858_10785 [Rhizobiaceae bacterium]|nr:hypothetical protein [Rhizobiaceae bacterium]